MGRDGLRYNKVINAEVFCQLLFYGGDETDLSDNEKWNGDLRTCVLSMRCHLFSYHY